MSFYRRWIVACAAGEFIGIGVAAGAALAINALIGEPQSLGSRLLTLGTFAAVGAVEGGALAGFQWRVLRARLPRLRAGEWVTGAQARLPRLARALIHTLVRPAFVRPEVGAIPVLRLAAHPDLSHLTGRYFDRCHLAPDVADPGLARTFWAACEDMTDEHESGEQDAWR